MAMDGDVVKATGPGTYKGHLRLGEPHGYGTQEAVPRPGTSHTYRGQWKHGVKEGDGELVVHPGNRFNGTFHDDLRQGPGCHTFPAATIEGDYVAGVLQGHGTRTLACGAVYEGEFRDNKMEGQGTLRGVDGSVYTGAFAADQRSGYGRTVWRDGEVYDGQYANDLRHGEGVYTWPDGRSYSGSFSQGARAGQGTFEWKSGDKFEGEWANDQRSGKGTMTYWDGRVDAGVWKGPKLVQLGAPTDLPGPLTQASTELLRAAEQGDAAVVLRLLQDGAAHVDVANASGYTGVFLASVAGQVDVVNAMLDIGADVNKRCAGGVSALSATYRLSKGLDPGKDGLPEEITPSSTASIEEGMYTEMACLLLRRGANPNVSASPYPVLLTAIESRDTSMVELLLEHGASANCEMVTSTGRDTALLRATGLLSKDLAASRPGRTKLRWQSGTTNPAARPTVKSVADAARLKMSKAAAIIELLLKYGADANLPGSGGRLPLHTAAAVDSSHAAHVVQALLGRGARTDVAWQGETPLSLAVRSGNDDVVSSLLDAGTDPNQRVGLHQELSILQVVVGKAQSDVRSFDARFELLQLLLRQGADPTRLVEVTCANGNMCKGTALDAAVEDYVTSSPLHKKNLSMVTVAERNQIIAEENVLKLLSNEMRAFQRNHPESPGAARFCEECCRATNVKLAPCARCHAVFFCSQACKMRGLSGYHKRYCRKRGKNERFGGGQGGPGIVWTPDGHPMAVPVRSRSAPPPKYVRKPPLSAEKPSSAMQASSVVRKTGAPASLRCKSQSSTKKPMVRGPRRVIRASEKTEPTVKEKFAELQRMKDLKLSR